MSKLLTHVLLGTFLLININSVFAQSNIWSDEHPSQAYTIYNGKIYVHPKKESFFSNLFNFDLYNNRVVQTVLGWSDMIYGTGAPINGTEELADIPLASQNHPQYLPSSQVPTAVPGSYPGPIPNPPTNMNPNPISAAPNPNAIPNYGDNFLSPSPDSMRQQSSFQYNNGPNSAYQMPSQPYPFQSQLPSWYPQPQPQVQTGYAYYPVQPAMGYPYYGNPNTEIINSVESHGTIEDLMQQAQSQERSFQMMEPTGRNILKRRSPSYNSIETTGDDDDDKPGSPDTEFVEDENDDEKGGPSTSDDDVQLDTVDVGDFYPCPKSGQWKWNGEVCIAIGDYPTWACMPNDLVMSGGTLAVCRNRIYYPNEA